MDVMRGLHNSCLLGLVLPTGVVLASCLFELVLPRGIALGSCLFRLVLHSGSELGVLLARAVYMMRVCWPEWRSVMRIV